MYAGCTALAAGNSLKAGVRFVSYDYLKSKLADSEVHNLGFFNACWLINLHRAKSAHRAVWLVWGARYALGDHLLNSLSTAGLGAEETFMYWNAWERAI